MRGNLATRQINRKRKRYIKKRQRKVKFASLGFLALLAFIFIMRPQLPQNSTAKADSAELLSSQAMDKEKDQDQPYEGEEAKTYRQFSQDDQGFSSFLKAYKILKKDGPVYKDASLESKSFATGKAGEYIRFYGYEGDWAKVSYKNSFGFMRADLLQETPEGVMTVKEGILYVDKDHKIASDYLGAFDVETENSLLIAIEAMNREGLEVDVARKYTSFEDEKDYIRNSKGDYDQPDAYTSELRTGFAVELHSLKTDPRIEDDFFDKEVGKWVRDNMHRFGFILRYPEGKEDVTGFEANQHIFRYVGADLAGYMHKNNLTMEEYFR